jgi:3-methyladenine DNA glycosylase Mpg
MDRRLRRSDFPVETVALACFLIEAYPVGDPAGHAFGGKTQRIKGAKVFAACNVLMAPDI